MPSGARRVRRPETPTVYLVRWPDGVSKFGYSAHGRWRAFVLRGARVVKTWQFEREADALAFEQVAHAHGHSKAFVSRVEARQYLGGSGGGWAECFRCSEQCTEQCSEQCTDAMLLHCAEDMLSAMQRRGEERRGLRGEGGNDTADMTVRNAHARNRGHQS